eukprot:9470192-Pyramimonas_sp.AAC.1
MEWCVHWARLRLDQLAYSTMDMAPNGGTTMAYDICKDAWDDTRELREIVRIGCGGLPREKRPGRSKGNDLVRSERNDARTEVASWKTPRPTL